jgi:hypothetical protein
MSKIAIAVILTALVAAPLGYIIGTSASAPDDAGALDARHAPVGGDAADPAAPRGAKLAPPAAEVRRSADSAPPAGTAVEDVPVHDSGLSAIVKSVALPAVERGDGVITGTVRTLDGGPVGGVTIRATRGAPQAGRRTPPKLADGRSGDLSLDDTAFNAVRDHLWNRRTRVEAESSSDGSFRIEGLTPGIGYQVGARAAGYRIGVRAIDDGVRIRAGDSVDFTARPSTKIVFEVQAADGMPVDEALIVCTAKGKSAGNQTETWRAAEPAMEIVNGDVTVRARAREDEQLHSEDLTLRVPLDGSVREPVVLRFRTHPGIAGKVVYAEGQRLSALAVHLTVAARGKLMSAEEFMKTKRQEQYLGSGDTTFQFDDLAAGSYQLAAVAGQSEVLGMALVDVQDTVARVEIACAPLTAAGYVVVKAVGAKGEPIEDAEMRQPWHGVVHIGPGLFYIARKPLNSEAFHDGGDGEATLVNVHSPTLGQRQATINRLKDNEVVLRFGAVATLDVRVAGASSSPYTSSLSVTLVASGNEVGGRTYYFHDVGGEAKRTDDIWQFTNVQPGAYTVSLKMQRGQWGARTLAAAEVQLAAGVNDLALGLPALSTLTLVLPAGSGKTVGLKRADRDDDYSEAPVGDDDRAVFEALAPGQYEVRLVNDGIEQELVRVSVPPSREVRIELRPANAMLVGGDAESAQFECGLASGDMIVGADGVAWEQNPSNRLFQALGDNGARTANLQVLRGGKVQDMLVDGKKLHGEWQKLRLAPVVR